VALKLAEAFVDIKANTAGLTKGLSSTFATIGALTAKFGPLGAAIGGVVGVGGFGLMLKGAFGAADALVETADRLGIGTEALAALRRSAELSGSSLDQLETGLSLMQNTISEAAAGSEIAQTALSKLGLSAEELINLSAEESFGRIADSINSLGTQAEKIQLTRDIFGRGGTSLLNVIAEGSAGLERITKDSIALGIALTKPEADQIAKANDLMEDFGKTIKGVFNIIALNLAPLISELATSMIEGMKPVAAFFRSALPTAVSIFRGVLEKMAPLFEVLRSAGASALSTVGSLLKSVGTTLISKFVEVIPLVTSGFQALVAFVGPILSSLSGLISSIVSTVLSLTASIFKAADASRSALSPVFSVISDSIVYAIDQLSLFVAQIPTIVSFAATILQEFFTPLRDAALAILAPIIEWASSLFSQFTSSVASNAQGAASGIGLISKILVMVLNVFDTARRIILSFFVSILEAVASSNAAIIGIATALNAPILAFKLFKAVVATAGSGIISVVALLAKGIQELANLIPGVSVSFGDSLTSFAQGLNALAAESRAAASEALKKPAISKESIGQFTNDLAKTAREKLTEELGKPLLGDRLKRNLEEKLKDIGKAPEVPFKPIPEPPKPKLPEERKLAEPEAPAAAAEATAAERRRAEFIGLQELAQRIQIAAFSDRNLEEQRKQTTILREIKTNTDPANQKNLAVLAPG
jgi:hypothetical protein